jgi:hypothetical protein
MGTSKSGRSHSANPELHAQACPWIAAELLLL